MTLTNEIKNRNDSRFKFFPMKQAYISMNGLVVDTITLLVANSNPKVQIQLYSYKFSSEWGNLKLQLLSGDDNEVLMINTGTGEKHMSEHSSQYNVPLAATNLGEPLNIKNISVLESAVNTGIHITYKEFEIN